MNSVTEFEVTSVCSPCVLWKTELPRVDREYFSPDFDLGGCLMQISLSCKALLIAHHPTTTRETFYIKVKSIQSTTTSISIYIIKENGQLHLAWNDKSKNLGKQPVDLFNFTRQNLEINGDVVSIVLRLDEDSKFCRDVFKSELKKKFQEIPGVICLSSLSDDIKKLYDKEEPSDVVLKCHDRKFFANKLILSVRSEVFAAMFRNQMSESETGMVDIEDLEPCVLEQFLQFVYSGKVENQSMDTVFDLYKAGDKYAVHSLKRNCAAFMLDHLSEDNVCQILLLGDTLADTQLLENAISFVVNRLEFLGSENWIAFSENHPTTAVKIFTKFSKK